MQKKDLSKRIWELDALRGIAIVLVCVLHAFKFLNTFTSIQIPLSPFVSAVAQYGGTIFIILSGICVAFSKSSTKRGIIVFLCGMFLTITTYALAETGLESQKILMQWTVLHLIGLGMILYPVFRKWSCAVQLILAVVIIVLGYIIQANVYVKNPYLFPLGFRTRWFTAFEWRPVLPNLGWFLLGIGLKPILYPDNVSLMPKITEYTPGINVLCTIGRYSLHIYMIHQIVYYVLIKLFLA